MVEMIIVFEVRNTVLWSMTHCKVERKEFRIRELSGQFSGILLASCGAHPQLLWVSPSALAGNLLGSELVLGILRISRGRVVQCSMNMGFSASRTPGSEHTASASVCYLRDDKRTRFPNSVSSHRRDEAEVFPEEASKGDISDPADALQTLDHDKT